MENGVKKDIVSFKADVEEFLSLTNDARLLSERDRDYYDHKQWSEAEIAKLKKRQQAPIVVNSIRPKVNGLVGLYAMRTTDPKAFARTQKHEQASHAITDALRFVADNVDFDDVKTECAYDFWIEGTCGAIVDIKQKRNGEIEIRTKRIPWDRLYWDPYSREKDFEDARYKGFMLWMHEDQVQTTFNLAQNQLDGLYDSGENLDGTFEDRPRWNNKEKKRIRVAYHFYKIGEEWHYCMFSGNTFLVDPQVSPFLDDEGEPTCIIEMESANVDRDNARYGEVRGYIPLQDEKNHRRSKGLHLFSSRQTKGRKGSVKDVAALKRELAKPDGHIEIEGEITDFDVLQTGDMAAGQMAMYQDAKAELDAVGFNAQLAGERQQGDLSGKAIGKLQQAGAIELHSQYGLLNSFEKRIYRQMWARVKQFWNEEKWVRVTDDHDNLRWVGLNSQITLQKALEEKINDESESLEVRTGASATFQIMMKNQDPRLNQIIEVRNDVAELDVDVKLEQSFDVMNTQQEQLDTLVQLGNKGGVDVLELIELMDIRNKDELVERIEKRRAAIAQSAGNMQQLEQQERQVKMRKTNAEAVDKEQAATQKKIENTLLIANPPEQVTSVSV